jgi:SAM-dependent methyltransferase
VLDLGCGSGRLLAELNRRLPLTHSVGVEMSERTLSIARERLRDVRGVTLEHASIEYCRAQEQTFDAVTCIGLCDYAPFADVMLRRALQAARQMVVVTVPRRRVNAQRLFRRTWLGVHGVALHAVSDDEIAEVCRRVAGDVWRIEVTLPVGLEDNYWIVARRRADSSGTAS